jgi:hypothetical protein
MREVTRLYCDGGRWINVGTTVYLIPTSGASLQFLREYKTVLSAKMDTYNNTVCLDENEAIKDIRSQMNIFQWIISKYI